VFPRGHFLFTRWDIFSRRMYRLTIMHSVPSRQTDDIIVPNCQCPITLRAVRSAKNRAGLLFTPKRIRVNEKVNVCTCARFRRRLSSFLKLSQASLGNCGGFALTSGQSSQIDMLMDDFCESISCHCRCAEHETRITAAFNATPDRSPGHADC